ncbi:MAG: putative RND superfamily exporter protein [Hyphomicrobiaceae bacterium]|jgi:predicted RND superfamily exporter protein
MAPRGTLEYERFEKFEEELGAGDSGWVLGRSDDELLSAESLARIARVTENLEALDGTETVVSLTNALDIRGSSAGLETKEFFGAPPLTQGQREEAGRRVMSDPVVGGLLISRDGRTTGMIARLTEWSTDPLLRVRYFAEVQAILDSEQIEGIEFHLTGLPDMDSVLVSHINSDSNVLIPLTGVVCTFLLWVVFGRLRATWLPIAPVLIAASWTLGVLAMSGRPMTLLTGQGVLTTLIMVIGLSDGVHLLNRYLENRALAPDDSPDTCLRSAMRDVGRACFLTSLTTSTGFLSLTASELPTVRDIGIYGALGIVFSYLGALVFMPAALILFERRRPMEPANQRALRLIDNALNLVGRTVARRPQVWVATGIGSMIASSVAATHVYVDSRYIRDLRAGDPAVTAQEFMEQSLGGSRPLDIVVQGDAADVIKRPEVLAAIERVRDGLLELPWITEASTPAEFVRKMNRALNDDDPAFFKIPDTAQAVAQSLLLF